MDAPGSGSWQTLGERLSGIYSQSPWRLLGICILGLGVPLAVLYLLRGPLGVQLGVAALGVAAVFMATFSHPFHAFLAGLFVFYSSLDVYLPGPVGRVLLAIAAARVLYDWLGGRRHDWGSPLFRAATTLVLAIACTSLLVATSLPKALAQVQSIFLGLAVYAAITGLVDRTERIRAVLVVLALGLGVNTAFLIGRIVRFGYMEWLLKPTGERLGTGIGDVNITATFACCLIPGLVHALARARWRGRLFLVLLLLLQVATVILCVSRIGMILLVLAAALLLLRARRARIAALVATAALAFFLLRLPESYWIRFVSLGQFGGVVVDRSLQLRQHALEAGWQIFREHPWLGVGLGNFSSETPRYMSVGLWAHNTYLDVAASLGVFGLAAFLLWQLSGLLMVHRAARLWRVARREEERTLAVGIGLSLALFYIGALTMDVAFHPILWIFLSLASAARMCAETGRR